MSLARALTSATKRMRTAQEPAADKGSTSPNRSFSSRRNYGIYEPIDRNQISLPVELLSTTNPLAYDAPDLKNINVRDFQQFTSNTLPSPSPSSAASYLSENESAGLGSGVSSASSVTTPSISREQSPTVTEHKSYDHYFAEPTFTAPVSPISTGPAESIAELPAIDFAIPAPQIPKRALSHTKKTHEILAHKRSSSRMRSPPNSVSLDNAHNNTTTGSDTPPRVRTSLDVFQTTTETGVVMPSHPFGPELAQVNELVEEINTPASECFSPSALAPPISFANEMNKGPRSPRRAGPMGRSGSQRGRFAPGAKNMGGREMDEVMVYDEEAAWMAESGLQRFGVEVYLAEIEGLYGGRWEEHGRGGWF